MENESTSSGQRINQIYKSLKIHVYCEVNAERARVAHAFILERAGGVFIHIVSLKCLLSVCNMSLQVQRYHPQRHRHTHTHCLYCYI